MMPARITNLRIFISNLPCVNYCLAVQAHLRLQQLAQLETGKHRKVHSLLFPTRGDYRRYEIQKFSETEWGRVAVPALSRVRIRVLKLEPLDREASAPRGTTRRSSPGCRSSNRTTSESKLRQEYKDGATGSTCCATRTRFDVAGSHPRVLQTRKDRDRKAQRVRLPSDETRSERRQQHPRVPRR